MGENRIEQKQREEQERRRREGLCVFVRRSFEERRQGRTPFELQWRLNMNFLSGNQYCDILPDTGELYQQEKPFFWQERETYNHIAPIIESRLAKLQKMRPSMVVRPATGDEADIESARVSTALLRSAYSRLCMKKLLEEGTVWSEVCGTVFYKQTWNGARGRVVSRRKDGKEVREGDLDITVCPPFEIYPDSAYVQSVEKCRSVIHARVYACDRIKELWGAQVQPETVEVFSIGGNALVAGGLGYQACVPSIGAQNAMGSALVLEYYEMPCEEYPGGRLIICTRDTLLYEGELPYRNGEGEERCLPFVQQNASARPGCLWGVSVIERCIPIQRAYNAVKNRKHEFLNRAAIGILAVEEGAVDTENLEEEGLSPGKVLIYRQGANPPQLLSPGSLPGEFFQEEQLLLQEFTLISGVSDLMRQSYVPSNVSSGVALNILTEQDDTRLATTAEHIRQALLEIARQWLRLFRQFGGQMRLERLVGENGSVSRLYWSASLLTSDDVIHETENELSQSVAQRRQMIYELLAKGIFHDAGGRLDDRTRSRLLRSLGLGAWESVADISDTHLQRAQRENLSMGKGMVCRAEVIDDHAIHLTEHKKYMLGEAFENMKKENPHGAAVFYAHIEEHGRLQAGKSEETEEEA